MPGVSPDAPFALNLAFPAAVAQLCVSPMKTPSQIAMFLTATLVFPWICAGQEFFQTVIALAADTNAQATIGARAPHLVNPDNTAYKFTNAVLTLRPALRLGEVAGIRLGMTMEEIVAALGKPSFIYPLCGPGPRFSYKDVQVYFEAKSNAVARITLRIDHLPTLKFDEGLSVDSSRADWVRVFGPQVCSKRPILPDLMSAAALVEFVLFDSGPYAIRVTHWRKSCKSAGRKHRP
jgi:hypothetical protein